MGFSSVFQPGMEDLNPDLSVKNRSLLRFCEDVAGFHTDSLGDGLLSMNETGQAWILMAWYLEVYQRPRYGEPLTVTTWPRQMAKVHAWRDFSICDRRGNRLAEATSKWIVVENGSHRVVRIPERMQELYPEEAGGTLAAWRPDRIELPETAERECVFPVRRSQADLLGHLHNLCYLDFAEDTLPEAAGVPGAKNHVSLVFKSELKAGECVTCRYRNSESQHQVHFCQGENLCARVCLW